MLQNPMNWRESMELGLLALFYFVVFFSLRLFTALVFDGEYWGMVGVYSAVFVLTYYLSVKGRMGLIGRIMIRKIEKYRKARIVSMAIIVDLFFVFFLGIMIIGLEYPVDRESVMNTVMVLNEAGIRDQESMMETRAEMYDDVGIATTVQAVLAMLLLPLLDFHLFAVTMQSVSHIVPWIFVLCTIMFFETVEKLCLLCYFKWKK